MYVGSTDVRVAGSSLSLSPRLLLLLLVRVSSAISKAVGKERMGADVEQLVLILGYLTISLFRRPVILEIQLFLFLPF